MFPCLITADYPHVGRHMSCVRWCKYSSSTAFLVSAVSPLHIASQHFKTRQSKVTDNRSKCHNKNISKATDYSYQLMMTLLGRNCLMLCFWKQQITSWMRRPEATLSPYRLHYDVILVWYGVGVVNGDFTIKLLNPCRKLCLCILGVKYVSAFLN